MRSMDSHLREEDLTLMMAKARHDTTSSGSEESLREN